MKIKLTLTTVALIAFSLFSKAQSKVDVYEILLDSAKLCIAEQKPDVAIDCLRHAFGLVVESNAKGRAQESVFSQIEEFFTHVKIQRSSENKHNVLPKLECTYDDQPLSTKAFLKTDELIDTIRFDNGFLFLKDVHNMGGCVSLLDFKTKSKNKSLNKMYNILVEKHKFSLTDQMINEKNNIFHAADDDLYYAAIESKKIPGFEISSNSRVINYASCLKAVLKASGIAAAYQDIINSYLGTSIDAESIELKNYDGIISGRRVITSIIQDVNFNAQFIVDELLKERFVIAVQRNGTVGLVTAIAFDASTSYNPVHVRMRLPILPEQDQRVQLSWADFMKRTTALVKIDIY